MAYIVSGDFQAHNININPVLTFYRHLAGAITFVSVASLEEMGEVRLERVIEAWKWWWVTGVLRWMRWRVTGE